MNRIFGKIGQIIQGDLCVGSQTFTLGSETVKVTQRGGRTIVLHAAGLDEGAASSLNAGLLRGSGVVASESRTLASVPTRLVVENLGAVEVLIGDGVACEVSADDNLLGNVNTCVEGSTLRIAFKGSAVVASPIVVRLTLPSIEKVSVKGSGSVSVAGLHQTDIACKVSGTGSVVLQGEVDALTARLSGTGAVDAAQLSARRADLEVSGVGNIVAHASEAVSIDLSGIGSVHVLGNPSVREIERSGLGAVTWG